MSQSKTEPSDYTRRFDETSCRNTSDPGRGDDAPVILAAELEAISIRRTRTGRTGADLTGVALSGGGIRSASFCLGVLQALDAVKERADPQREKTAPKRSAFDRIDYLSTVSGGGYIGCCLTACLQGTKGLFPFNEPDGGYGDTDAVHHIRDFSNYLMPRGPRDLVTSLGIVACGLAANACLVAPVLLIMALCLIWLYPTVDSLCSYGVLEGPVSYVRQSGLSIIPGLPLTTAVLALALPILVIWALKRSAPSRLPKAVVGEKPVSTELSGPFVGLWRLLVLAASIAFWLDLQPLVLAALARQQHLLSCGTAQPAAIKYFDGALSNYLTWITPILSPVAGLIAFLSRRVNRAARPDRQRRWAGLFRRLAAKAALLLAAIILPSLLWLAYLQLTLALQERPSAVFVAFLIALLFVVLALSVDPNLTSLHRLYRDRLAKAFLFDADQTEVRSKGSTAAVADRLPINPKLHDIDTGFGPFPIINAALNLEGSPFANRRGRNADFFELTPLFVGSEATGWRRTKSMEISEPKLDLGTAMAISGAAVSPNMGTATIKALTPTLALLNLRLGFWIRNPAREAGRQSLRDYLMDVPALAMAKEILSRISEEDATVYLTDGGNIENLGVHALLKRRCKLIIAVDAEADPDMSFAAFLRLQRYARIDLGVLVDLPWQKVRDRTLEVSRAFASGEKVEELDGPHVAVGTIRYSSNRKEDGTLVYIKSSLTGDESDYILDYKARNPDFPHETTGDQFFGEEQLEVYRALGFHEMRLFLDGEAKAAVVPETNETVAQATERVRTLLIGQA